MHSGDEAIIRRASGSDAVAMAELWLRSFTTALPSVRRAHTDDEVRKWFQSVVVPHREAWVAVAQNTVVGLLVLGDAELEQLYLDPPWRGRGLGDRLVGLAKQRRPDGLELRTFQVNGPARRFYERHGFVAAEFTDGRDNEEHEPDIRYRWAAGPLCRMQGIASRLWEPGRRWTPGEIAWSFVTDDGEQDVRFADDGSGLIWQSDIAIFMMNDTGTWVTQALSSLPDDVPVEASDRDPVTSLLTQLGYREIPDAPFSLTMQLPVDTAAAPELRDGYRVRPARPHDDLLSVHQASWRPADLPFAPGHAPASDPEAVSPFTRAALEAVQRTWPYRLDLHIVAEAPDGSLAGSCITWLDPATGVAAIEPLGVDPRHRNKGLAGALCLEAARQVRAAGGHELVIHPRGDAAYPAPRGAYLKCGFTATGRTRLYLRPR